MTQTERISHNENLLNRGIEVINRLEQALADFAALEPAIAELQAYYDSDDWRND